MAVPFRKPPADLEPDLSGPGTDPFRYGWRWQRVHLPSGEVTEQQIPLTVDDLLDPQLGDEVTQSGPHGQWFVRLGYLLQQYYESRDDVLVCLDMKMIWGIPGLPGPSPDVAIVQGIRDKAAERSSFDVLKEGVRPCLILELVSSLDNAVRANDYEKKVDIYARAGIPEYFILDPPTLATKGLLLLTAYRLGLNGRYRPIEPNAEGRLLSATTGLLFGVEGDQTLLILDSKTGERPLDFAENRARLAEERADREMEARKAVEAENAQLRLELERARKPASKSP